ncbi:Transcription factor spt8 [Clavispora lusitaniae]|nr:Transcription factor spt8 [Clavispora lusitaniae]
MHSIINKPQFLSTMSMDEDLFNVAENEDSVLEEDIENSDMDMEDAGGDMELSQNGEEQDEEEEDDEEDDEGEEGDDGEEGEEGEENEDEGDENEDENDDNNEERSINEDVDMDKEKSTQATENDENGTKASSAQNVHKSASEVLKETHDNQTLREKIIAGMKSASDFDIVPVVAIPYAQQCHALAISDGPKWILTGGEDGFIRKYDFTASIEGKAPLTVAQKHNLMDSITKAGAIGSYWENEQPLTKRQILNENPKLKESDFTAGSAAYEPKVNPVYSLDVERNGYWCLSGLLSGGISLYTMIYNEGVIHHYFPHCAKKTNEQSIMTGHSDAVSVIKLNFVQNKFLSGSWDKSIREWDLNTGKVVNLFKGSTGQISQIHYRPQGVVDISFNPDTETAENQSDVDSLFGDSDGEDNDKSNDNDENTSISNIKSNTSKNKLSTSDSIFMSSSIDGTINIWDARVSGTNAVLKLGVPEGVPPWCMSAMWSNDGDKLYVGRRNSTVEEINIRMPHARGIGSTMIPNVSKRLQFPKISGPVTALSTMPNDSFLLCGSNDNIRLYNLGLYDDFNSEATTKKRATPFLVIPGHHGGVLSNLRVDDTGRFMISTSGNRGWGHSSYADVVLVYSIDHD